MDIATHFFVPYAAALLALGFWRRDAPGDDARAAWALAFGLGGFAPDLDGGLRWLVERVDALWWMQHRGVSHTLVGAPVFALFFAGVLALLARRFPRRLALVAWRPGLALAAVLGSMTHLLLDILTYAGVPLLWPFAEGRVSLRVYGWLLFEMLLPLTVVSALHLWGKATRRHVIVVGALAVAYLLVVGGMRLAERPAEPEGGHVFPRTKGEGWLVLTPHANGSWEARADGHEAQWYADDAPPEAAEAIARAEDTHTFRGFRMGLFGPLVTTARPLPDASGWNVTFVAVAQRYEALHDPSWTPTRPHDRWGMMGFEVRGDEVRETWRGW